MAPAENYKSDSRIDLEEGDDDDEDLERSVEVREKGGGGLLPEADDQTTTTTKGGDDPEDKKNSKSKMENFKYYTSLFLGTLSIVCIFAFLFLVPFVLDPVSTTAIFLSIV